MNDGYTSLEREEMIHRHLPLVNQIVEQIGRKNQQDLDKDDLLSIGVMGLMDAISKYDKTKNIPFESYARWRIKGSILDELRKNGKVSRERIKKLKLVYGAKDILQQRLLREPSDEEICEELEITQKELQGIQETVHYLSHFSLEKVLFSGDEDAFRLMDVVEDKNTKTPERIFLDQERNTSLMEAIEKLPERERLILNLYYYEGLKLKEIGDILEVSLSRVSQLHGRALIRLRDLLKNV